MEAKLVINILVWKGLRSMTNRGSRPKWSSSRASPSTSLGSRGMENMKAANLSVLFWFTGRLFSSIRALIFSLMVNTLSPGSKKTLTVV